MFLLLQALTTSTLQIADYFLEESYRNAFVVKLTTDKTANPKAILTTIESSNGRYESSFP